MKAIIHSGQSGLEGLQYTDFADRTPAYGEVKIQLKSAGSALPKPAYLSWVEAGVLSLSG